MRNEIGRKGFVSDKFNDPNKLVINTDPSISGGLKFRGKKVLPDSIVWVENVGDFPESVNGLINLETGSNYLITRQVNIGSSSFVVPDDVSFFGFDRKGTGIISTKTGSALFSGSKGITIHHCNLQTLGSGSSIFDISSLLY